MEEHDTWPSSNRSVDWHFECAQCAAEYVFHYHLGEYIVRKANAEKHRTMSAERQAARERVYEVAAPKYENKWVEYVLSLPTKKAMNEAIADCSYQTFLKRASSKEWIEEQARLRFRIGPKVCLDQLKIEDGEVSEADAAAIGAGKAADEFWSNVDKKVVPFR